MENLPDFLLRACHCGQSKVGLDGCTSPGKRNIRIDSFCQNPPEQHFLLYTVKLFHKAPWCPARCRRGEDAGDFLPHQLHFSSIHRLAKLVRLLPTRRRVWRIPFPSPHDHYLPCRETLSVQSSFYPPSSSSWTYLDLSLPWTKKLHSWRGNPQRNQLGGEHLVPGAGSTPRVEKW